MEEIKDTDIKLKSTPQLIKMRENIEKELLKSKKIYKKGNIITNTMGVLAAAGLGTFVVAFNPILKISGLFFGFCSSCIGCYVMGSKKYLYAKAEYDNAAKISFEVTKELNERYFDEEWEERHEDTM